MIPTLVCYLFSLIFLFIRLKTNKKRDFIISVFMILIGSILGRIEYEFSVLNYFLIAILLSFFGDMLMAEYIKITNFRTIDGVMMFGLAHIMYIISFYQFNIGGYNLEFSLEGLYDFLITILCIFTAYILYNKVGSSEKMNDAIKFAESVLHNHSDYIIYLSFEFCNNIYNSYSDEIYFIIWNFIIYNFRLFIEL